MILRRLGLIFGLGLFFSTHSFALTEIVGKDFTQKNLTKTIQNTRFIDCKFNHATFKKTYLLNVSFIKSTLIDTDFSESTLVGVSFEQSNLGGSRFHNMVGNEVNIRSSNAPKISFWKALVTGLRIRNSSLLALDLSQSRLTNGEISESFIEDSFLKPLSSKSFTLINNFADVLTIAPDLKDAQLKPAAGFKLLNDVIVTEAPELSTGCLKRYPLNKNRSNGPKMLTNGSIQGGCFNACLKQQSFTLELNPQNWPESLRESLWVEVVTTVSTAKFSSNLNIENVEKSIFFKIDPTPSKIKLKLESPDEFGIYEIRMVLRSAK